MFQTILSVLVRPRVVALTILPHSYAIIFIIMSRRDPLQQMVPRQSRELELIKNHRRQSTILAVTIGCAVGVFSSGQNGFFSLLMCCIATLGGFWLVYEQFFAPKHGINKSANMSNSLYGERSAILIRILKVHGAMNYDNLKDQSQFLEKALVPTLQRMVQEGVVDEELDVENGQWRYKLSSDYVVIQTKVAIGKDLNQRMKDLER
tara:strand:+ start:4701 stop:5318 length:618 start_codon:yes stop_codon:yes gene_type:complete